MQQKLEIFFYDHCSAEDANEVESWLSDEHNAKEVDSSLSELMDKIYATTKPNEERNLAAFDKFKQKIAIPQNKEIHLKRRRTFFYAAASLAFLIMASSIAFMYREMYTPIEWVQVFIPNGQTKNIVLPDNSTIHLNSGSKLIYPKKFNRKFRQIFVTGEIFADIAKDKKRRFIMSAGEVNVKVFGTKFNLKAYPEDSKVEVSLIEGSVCVEFSWGNRFTSQMITQGESVQLDKLSGNIESHYFNKDNFYSWQSNEIQFKNQRFGDIITQLTRTFDKQIVIQDQSLLNRKFYATFVNQEDLMNILTALNGDKKMSIVEKEGIIYIGKR